MSYPPRLPTRHATYRLQLLLSSKRVAVGLAVLAVVVAVSWARL